MDSAVFWAGMGDAVLAVPGGGAKMAKLVIIAEYKYSGCSGGSGSGGN